MVKKKTNLLRNYLQKLKLNLILIKQCFKLYNIWKRVAQQSTQAERKWDITPKCHHKKWKLMILMQWYAMSSFNWRVCCMAGKQKPINITCILNIEKTSKQTVTIETEINLANMIITQSFSDSYKFDSVSE